MINVISDSNVLNGVVVNKEKIEEVINNDTTRIYEVIRVIKRNPAFLYEHYNRFANSIKLSNIDYNIKFEDFKSSIMLLINNNNFENCNIRVSFDMKDVPLLAMYFIKSFYPDRNFYENGIHTVTIVKERENPNIKKNTVTYRDEIDKVLKEQNAFEAILVNHDETISEGSKSNVFFVKNNSLITARDEDILLGVTRSKVIEIAEKIGIKVEKRKINVNEINNFDAAFITGTSNNVLPIRTINAIILNSTNNEIVKKLMIQYEELLINK